MEEEAICSQYQLLSDNPDAERSNQSGRLQRTQIAEAVIYRKIIALFRETTRIAEKAFDC